MNFIDSPSHHSDARPLRGPGWLDVRGPSKDALHARRRFAWLGAAASLAIVAASVFVLFRILSGIDATELSAAFTAASLRQIGLCAAFTALSYLLLTGYDAVALRQLRLDIPYRTTALASFTSYAVSFNLGFPLLTAATVRYWIYASRGLRPGKVASLTVVTGMTFWLGMGMTLAWGLSRHADAVAALTYTHAAFNRLIGFAALTVVVGYLVWVSTAPRVVRVHGWRLELPGFGLSAAQILIGACDICAGAAALYVLLPDGHGVGYETFLAIYVAAVMLGIASHAPGGLGVFEVTILLALSHLSREPVLGALLLFRLFYYLIPFVLALALLGAYEIAKRLKNARRVLEPDDAED